MNAYKTCDTCKHERKKFDVEPCKSCYKLMSYNIERKNWKGKNILITIMAWFED